MSAQGLVPPRGGHREAAAQAATGPGRSGQGRPATAAGRVAAWWSAWPGLRPLADDATAAAAAVRDVLSSGVLDLPLPGGGQTTERWAALAALGAADLVLARLAEGHVDAVAIRAELGAPPLPGSVLQGVWAAEPPSARLEARRSAAGGWTLHGRKAWCSGATCVDVALVTAWASAGEEAPRQRLFSLAVSDSRVRPVPGTWDAVGMAGSDTLVVEVDGASAEPVGACGAYTGRPGFWHGGVGVAAVWLGGARAVAGRLLRAAAAPDRPSDPHTAAHLGAVDVRLAAAGALLTAAAAELDAAPEDVAEARARAGRVRGLIELTAAEVLERTGRALGAGPLCVDAEHARRVADLTTYLRQHHGERDLAAHAAVLVDGAAAEPRDDR